MFIDRRSAGSASSSELFASTGELLDRDSSRGLRVRGASAGHSSKFSLPNLLERDAVRMARERDRERSASSDVLLSTSPAASNTMLSNVIDQQSGDGEDEDGGWDRLVITRLSSKRRSSVPDTRDERGSAEASEPRSTTLPRSATALSAVENELDLGSSSSPSISASTAGVKKSLSLLLSHTTNSASESSLNTSNDATPVRSARYRPPGFRGHATPLETTPKTPQRNSPQRAPSAPRLGIESVTPRSSGSAASLSSRRNVRSMLAGELTFLFLHNFLTVGGCFLSTAVRHEFRSWSSTAVPRQINHTVFLFIVFYGSRFSHPWGSSPTARQLPATPNNRLSYFSDVYWSIKWGFFRR